MEPAHSSTAESLPSGSSRVAKTVNPDWRQQSKRRATPDSVCLEPRFDRVSNSAPGWIRTSDFCLRRAALYPLSYGRLTRTAV